MSVIDSTLGEFDVEEAHLDDAKKAARSKYDFEYQIDGVTYRTWYEVDSNTLCFDCVEKGKELFQLAIDINRLIRKAHLQSGIDMTDLRGFACGHIQAMTKFGQEFERILASEHECNVLN
jgi:hypothetical protein